MTPTPARCLILACGNTLRSDDGVGPWLAEWAEETFASDAGVRVLIHQQWPPELAEEIAHADSVLFIDCSVEADAGTLDLKQVHAAAPKMGLATHHLGAPELLALAQELYASTPRKSMLLTIGAGSTELGEAFSDPVIDVLPEACALIEETILKWLSDPAIS
jgi:hydrogenase maturation protease